MVLHRLVEVKGGKGRRIEPGEPHGTHEHKLQRVFRVLEIVFDVVPVLVYAVHPVTVRFDVELLLGEFLFLVRVLTYDNGHLDRSHVIQLLLEQLLFINVSRFLNLAAKLLDLLLPEALNLVIHLHGGELVQGYHHTFAEVAAPREMVNDVLGDGIQTAVPLDDLDFLRKFVFQFLLLRVVQILVLANLGEFLSEIVVLNENLWDTLLVKQRYSCTVVHGLPKIVFRNVTTKPLIGLAFFTQQGGAGKCDKLRVLQTSAHVLC